MKAVVCGVPALDRGCCAGALMLAALGLCRALGADPESFLGTDGSFASCYAQLNESGLVACIVVPLFSFCIAGALRPLASAAWVARMPRRTAALAPCLGAITARSALCAVVFVICGVVGVLWGSGQAYEVFEAALFAAAATLLAVLFFCVTGLIMLVAAVWWGPGVFPFVAAVAYGSIDVLVGMSPLGANPAFYLGWGLVEAGVVGGVSTFIPSAARLAAFAVLAVIATRIALGRSDFVERGGDAP